MYTIGDSFYAETAGRLWLIFVDTNLFMTFYVWFWDDSKPGNLFCILNNNGAISYIERGSISNSKGWQ